MVFLGSRACADLASKMHVVLRDSHADHPNINFEILSKMQPFQRDQNFVIMLPTKHNSDQKLTFCPPIPTPNSPLPSLPITLPALFPKFSLAISVPLPKGRAGTVWEPSAQLTFVTPTPSPLISVVPVAHCTLPSVFSLLLPLSSLKG